MISMMKIWNQNKKSKMKIKNRNQIIERKIKKLWIHKEITMVSNRPSNSISNLINPEYESMKQNRKIL